MGRKHRGKQNGKNCGKKAQMHAAARKPKLSANVRLTRAGQEPFFHSFFHHSKAETSSRNSGLQDSHRNHPFVLVSKKS